MPLFSTRLKSRSQQRESRVRRQVRLANSIVDYNNNDTEPKPPDEC